MELVGASWRFISWPYLKKGIMNGFWSAVIAILMLGALLLGIQNELEEIQQLSSWSTLGWLSGLLIFIGIVISGSSTYYVVN